MSITTVFGKQITQIITFLFCFPLFIFLFLFSFQEAIENFNISSQSSSHLIALRQGQNMYNPSPYSSPYPVPSSYGRTLPRPTSSGTLDNDVKRQKLNQPTPYYYPQYQFGQPPTVSVPPTAPASGAGPAPYYTPPAPSAPPAYGTYWNRPVYSPPTVPYMTIPQAQAPKQGSSRIPQDEQSRKTPLKDDPSIEELDEAEDEDVNGDGPESSSSAIQGTSITLATEEDIKQWREERKKMWLLKISNKRKEHMETMGIKEEELKGQSVLQETKKQKQFIQSIQNQVGRTNPKSNLDVKIVQREMAQENSKLLEFIRELGDAHLLEYQLTPEEKLKLFGPPDDKQRNAKKPFVRNNINNKRGKS